MNSYLLANKAIQYGVSVTLYFLILAGIVELSIKTFRIQNHRFKASLRFLTILNIVLSPLLLLLPKKWVFINTNIFGCAHPLQKYCFNLLYTHCELYSSGVYGVNTVLGKWLMPIPMSILSLILILALFVSIFKLSALGISYFNARKKFKKIQRNGSVNLQPIENLKLARNLIKYRTSIIISKETQVPFAGFGNCIVIPAHLLKILSQTEFEAIVSHELEHIIWKDGIARAFCQTIASIFWWIPIKNWLHGLMHEQELACDDAINHYQLSGIDLAQALNKTLRCSIDTPENCPAFASHLYLSERESTLERFHFILQPRNPEYLNRLKCITTFLFILISACSIGYIIC